MKKLPVEADVPERLVEIGLQSGATEKERAVGDDALIAYYYLLRIGEHTVYKGARTCRPTSAAKQTEQFKMKDVTFFCTNSQGRLY